MIRAHFTILVLFLPGIEWDWAVQWQACRKGVVLLGANGFTERVLEAPTYFISKSVDALRDPEMGVPFRQMN